jgi:hypothetical protein
MTVLIVWNVANKQTLTFDSMHHISYFGGEMCINYMRALNVGFDDKTADEIPIAWPAACRNRYLVLGSRGASGKSAGSIAVLLRI